MAYITVCKTQNYDSFWDYLQYAAIAVDERNEI
jgi:hypothetical protein